MEINLNGTYSDGTIQLTMVFFFSGKVNLHARVQLIIQTQFFC